MIATLSLARAIEESSPIYFIAVIFSISAVISTGSRSGLLGLIVALFIITVLMARAIQGRDYAGISAIVVPSLLIIPKVLDESVVDRITGWVSITSGGIALSDSTAANSFRIRLQLIEKAFDLFSKQPIFGYGWFAVPSRVGYLDVYYTTLLVETGVVGFVLFLFVHLSFIGSWLTDRTNGAFAIGSACSAWYCGLLSQSIAGTFPRTPQILLVSFFLLVSSKAISHESAEG
jgi:O-antigen ligase